MSSGNTSTKRKGKVKDYSVSYQSVVGGHHSTIITVKNFVHSIIHSLLFCVFDIDIVGQLPEPERPSPHSQLPERHSEALWHSASALAWRTCDGNMIDRGDTTGNKLLFSGENYHTSFFSWRHTEAVFRRILVIYQSHRTAVMCYLYNCLRYWNLFGLYKVHRLFNT